MPHATKVGLSNAMTARASAHLLQQLYPDNNLTGRDLAQILPTLLYLQKQTSRAIDINEFELSGFIEKLHPAPRIHLSGAQNAQEAEALISEIVKQTHVTDGKVVLGFNRDVLSELKLKSTPDALHYYEFSGIRFVANEDVPDSRDALAALLGTSLIQLTTVNVVISRKLQADPVIIERLTRLSSEQDLKTNLFLLIDELSPLVVPLTGGMSDLLNIAKLDRLISTQA